MGTAPVRTGTIQRTVSAYGTIGPGPGASETQTIAYAGIVKRVDVIAGSTVRRGEPLAVIGTAPSARATYVQAKAALRAARQTLSHVKSLVSGHLATRTQMAQAVQAEVAARSSLDALRREGADKTSAMITAPYDGVVSTVATTPGARLQAGAPIMTILRGNALIATVGLDSIQASRVYPNATVALTPFTDGSGNSVQGTVQAISSMVNPKSGLVDATIAIQPGATGPRTIRVGEPVEAKIAIGAAHGVIVPRDAALPDGRGAVIWQVKSKHAVRVTVHIVASAHGHSIVAGPIDPALPIVIEGNYQLTSGVAVRTR